MAFQILNEPSAATSLGSALGTGLGGGLQNLAQLKLQELLQQRQQAQTAPLFKSLGLPEQLGYLEPGVQREFIKQHLLAPQRAQQGSILQSLGLPAEIGLLPSPTQNALIKRLLPQAEQAQLEDLLGSLQPQQESPIKSSTEEPVSDKAILKEENNIKKIEKSKPFGYELAPMAKGEIELISLNDALKNPNLSSLQRAKIRQEVEKRQATFEKQQEKVDKITEPIYNKINEEAEGAREGNQRLTRMLQLVNTGQLVGPVTGALLETAEHFIPTLGVGINLFGLTSTETQEFKKIQADFLRDVKKIFGARVTNDEVKRYLHRIPSLNQSDEGKRRVINDLTLFNDTALAKKQIMDQIIEENGGFRPHNLDKLVEERSKPLLDEIANKFKEMTISPQELAREYGVRKSPVGRLIGGLSSLFS